MSKLRLVIGHRGAGDLVALYLECGHSVVRKDRGVHYPRTKESAIEHARAYAVGETDVKPVLAVCPECT